MCVHAFVNFFIVVFLRLRLKSSLHRYRKIRPVERYRRSSAFSVYSAEAHSSVGSIADLRTGGHWLGQYSSRGLMIVIATGFIPLSQLSVVSTVVMWESSQWLGKNIVRSTG